MGAKTTITGNLGQNPTLKSIDVDSKGTTEKRNVCEFSVFQRHERFDKAKDDWVDAGGFWVEVSVWGHEAEQLTKVLRKGSAVRVTGDQYVWEWRDSDDAKRQSIKIEAERGGVSLMTYNIDSITLRNSNGSTGNKSASQPDGGAALPPQDG